MKIKNLSFLSLIVLLLNIHCKKDSGSSSTPTDTPGTINITLPAPNTIAINGPGLIVEGDMTDLNGLATAKMEIKNKNTGAIFNQQSAATGGVSFYRFSFSWPVSGITVLTPATVKVTCIDKNGKQVSKEVDILLDN